jgi:CRISPR type IV-associated protein Csf3
MKIYSALPEGNQMADLEPARYFNLAIEQINEIHAWLKTAEEASQPLLVHIDIFLHLSKKYPEMAKRRVAKLNVPQIEETFNAWYERCSKKIPAKFRDEIKASADQLFSELKKV